ncbi:hypothetical protein Pcinc_016728 [Petrolisthes cinctipes]|uniref:Uncharacterized protein n=1 Tax=Petrolisthes cinctipes TaxID=88211 RepID=A0AAE1KNI0_PETCI|nr:hypothetical protein Pcinc_016728 [Petrolisthes cinctipes]
MYRQMIHGISIPKAAGQLRQDGLRKLYRGLLPPLCQKTISTSIMFGTFDQYKKMLHGRYPELSDITTTGVSAALAGCTEAVLCPMERIQTVL